MRLSLCLTVVSALFLVASAQNFVSLDEMTIGQDLLIITGGTPLTLTSQVNLGSSSSIFGNRDLIVNWLTGQEGTNANGCKATTGISANANNWIGESGTDCAGEITLQYDADDSSASLTPLQVPINFKNLGFAVFTQASTDVLEQPITFKAYSGLTGVSTFTTNMQNRTSSGQVFPITVPFTSFSGNADFTAINAFEVVTNGITNRDTIVNLLRIISSTVTGTVFVECSSSCDGTMNAGTDIVLSGINVQLVPATSGSGACASGTPTLSTTTDSNGQYLFENLPYCKYTVTVSGTADNGVSIGSLIICSGSDNSKTGTTSSSSTTITLNFNYKDQSSLSAPNDQSVTCNLYDSTDFGSATTGSICNSGSGTPTVTTQITNGNCDGNFVVRRTFTLSGQSDTQVITVTDSGVGPVLSSCPSDFTTSACNSQLNPANTGGFPTVNDDCSTAIDIDFFDVAAPSTCETGSCTTIKAITRTWTAYDDCGNKNLDGNNCIQTISVPACASATKCPSAPNCNARRTVHNPNAPNFGFEVVDDVVVVEEVAASAQKETKGAFGSIFSFLF